MKLKHLLYLFLALPLLWGCNNGDDVNEIFVSGTWNVGNFYNGGDWNKLNDGARAKYTKEDDIKAFFNASISSLLFPLGVAVVLSWVMEMVRSSPFALQLAVKVPLFMRP